MARGWTWCLGNTGSPSASTPKVSTPLQRSDGFVWRLYRPCVLRLSVFEQADTSAPTSTCRPACPRGAEATGTTTKTAPSLCSAPLRPDSWVSSWSRSVLSSGEPVLTPGTLSFVPLGEALLESHTAVDFVYCSPSLRCVQTAQHIVQGRSAPSSSGSRSPGNVWTRLPFVPSLMRNSCGISHISYGRRISVDLKL